MSSLSSLGHNEESPLEKRKGQNKRGRGKVAAAITIGLGERRRLDKSTGGKTKNPCIWRVSYGLRGNRPRAQIRDKEFRRTMKSGQSQQRRNKDLDSRDSISRSKPKNNQVFLQ